jgi:hypothetical protein
LTATEGATARTDPGPWRMPLSQETYDRSPLTAEEFAALAVCAQPGRLHQISPAYRQARASLMRLDRPLADVFFLRHTAGSTSSLSSAQVIMRREMYRRGTAFWDWTVEEWAATIGADAVAFRVRHQTGDTRPVFWDAAYLFGGISDLRTIGLSRMAADTASVIFGATLMAQQTDRVLATLVGHAGIGYAEKGLGQKMRQILSMVLLLQRSPYLEDITEAVIAAEEADQRGRHVPMTKLRLALQRLGVLETGTVPVPVRAVDPDATGVDPAWYGWCMAWYGHSGRRVPGVRVEHLRRLLVVGRWLCDQAPEVCTPEQWTETLARRFRSDCARWTAGQYASPAGREVLAGQGRLGYPLGPAAVKHYLVALRVFFSDLARRPHAPNGQPARTLRLDFDPLDALAEPEDIARQLDAASPRDVDERIWSKLVVAAATLSEDDLSAGALYPLSFYRAMALLWVSAARRPNELCRLRVGCVRREADPGMLDEDGQSLLNSLPLIETLREHDATGGGDLPPLCSLLVPSGKSSGPAWVWIPAYVAAAVDRWAAERPANQEPLYDTRDNQFVDYLFCFKNRRVGGTFLNNVLIPRLCRKAGVPREDAIGPITGHRGRSSRLTQLRRCGMGLDDLADYALHKNTATIRRYARQSPIQLHHRLRAADDVSRILEGVVDLQAAGRGQQPVRWLIGYDADEQPAYCANAAFQTCPHRLDCLRCGMFIGGEKARLLQESESSLRITAAVPMTPIERCINAGDEAGARICREALQGVPAPDPPSLEAVFNPAGLTTAYLERLAQEGTWQALEILRQALAAQEAQLAGLEERKTGRSALVGAKRRVVEHIRVLERTCAGQVTVQQRKQTG